MSIHTGKHGYDAFREFHTRTQRELATQKGEVWEKDLTPPMTEIGWVLAHLRDATSVLELGCGLGPYANFLLGVGVSEYLGVDFIPERIAWARANRPFAAEFVEGDARNIRLLRRFDVVLIVTVLQHLTLPDAGAVLRTAAHHLRPGGRVLMLESRIMDAPEAEAERRYAAPTCATHMIPKPLGALQAAAPGLAWECQVDGKHDGYILQKTAP